MVEVSLLSSWRWTPGSFGASLDLQESVRVTWTHGGRLPAPFQAQLVGRHSNVKLRHRDKASLSRSPLRKEPFSPNKENRHRPRRRRGHQGQRARLPGQDMVFQTLV